MAGQSSFKNENTRMLICSQESRSQQIAKKHAAAKASELCRERERTLKRNIVSIFKANKVWFPIDKRLVSSQVLFNCMGWLTSEESFNLYC